MNSRKIIEHSKKLLEAYENICLGIPCDFCNPLVIEESEILETYLAKHNVLIIFILDS
jgi:hypothetical protein